MQFRAYKIIKQDSLIFFTYKKKLLTKLVLIFSLINNEQFEIIELIRLKKC